MERAGKGGAAEEGEEGEQRRAPEGLATRSLSCSLPTVCPHCGLEFSCQNRLLYHLHEQHGEPMFVCTVEGCCKAYRRRDHLERHVRDVHMGIRSYKCTVPGCTAAYFNHTNLLKHLKSHQTQFKCTYPGCTEEFRKKSQLRAHMSAVHTGDPKKPYKCSQCSRCFGYPGQLALHERMHAAVDHVCGFDNCGFVARSLEELRKHMLEAHTPETAGDSQQSQDAAAATTPAPPGAAAQGRRAKCPVCGKELMAKSMSKHMLTHDTNAPMYACTVPGCSKVYCSKASLRAHFNASHSDHRFVCPHCSASFAYKVSMVQHIARVHSSDDTQPQATTPATAPSSQPKTEPERTADRGGTGPGLVRCASACLFQSPNKRACRIAGLSKLDAAAEADELLPTTVAPPPPLLPQDTPQSSPQTAPTSA